MRGGALVARLLRVAERELGWQGWWWWWWRNERGPTKINHDAVDDSLKLCSPTKITFNIDTCSSENKIKLLKFHCKDIGSKISGQNTQK